MTPGLALLTSIRVKNGGKKRLCRVLPLHTMMIERHGGVDAKFKWDISDQPYQDIHDSMMEKLFATNSGFDFRSDP